VGVAAGALVDDVGGGAAGSVVVGEVGEVGAAGVADVGSDELQAAPTRAMARARVATVRFMMEEIVKGVGRCAPPPLL